MIAILVVLVGLAVVFGSQEFAKKLLHGVIALVLLLSVLPCFIAEAGAADAGGGCNSTTGAGAVALLLLLAGIGFGLWKARHVLAERRHGNAKRWNTPRDRAVPPPPRDEYDQRHSS